MANNIWVNRATAQVLTSTDATDMTNRFGSTVDFSTYASNAEWIYDPDLSAVAGEPTKYWIITGDVITLMDQAAQDVVDAAAETTQLDSISDELDQTRTILRAFAEVVLDQVNALRADHGRNALTLAQLKTAVRGKL